jgi:hypothetical protein
MFPLVDECSYVVLDQRRTIDTNSVALQHRLFLWWEAFWNGIRQSVGLDGSVDPAEFTRQHKITALLHGDEVISMHLLSIFDKDEFLRDPYFLKYDDSFGRNLDALNVRRVLTLQYYSADARFRRHKPFMYFPATIGSLSMLHQDAENADAVVSVTRRDLGISNSLEKLNFRPLQADSVHKNTPISYQISPRPLQYPSDSVQALTRHFWSHKRELPQC